MYNPPRPPEVYTLPDTLNDAIPPEVRQSFQHDGAGRILFFTAPPLDRLHKGISNDSAGLGHSIKYLAGREKWLTDREKKRKDRDEKLNMESQKRLELEAAAQESRQELSLQATNAMAQWIEHIDDDTQRWKREAGLEGWREVPEQKSIA